MRLDTWVDRAHAIARYEREISSLLRPWWLGRGNAVSDGIWDALHGLGNRNQFNQNSHAWRTYNLAYNYVTEDIAFSWIDREAAA
jgi:hypothetical protein